MANAWALVVLDEDTIGFPVHRSAMREAHSMAEQLVFGRAVVVDLSSV